MRFKLPKHWGWFALGLTVFVVIAADVTTTMFDTGYFSVSDTLVTLRGTLTNWAKLNTNQVAQSANWSASGTTNSTLPGTASVYSLVVSNGGSFGGTLPSYFTNGVQDPTITSKVVMANATNRYQAVTGVGAIKDTGAQAAASDLSNGTTGSGAVVLSNNPTMQTPLFAGQVRWTGTTNDVLGSPTLTTTQKNALSGVVAGDHVYDSTLQRYQVYDGSAWHSRVRLDGDTMTGGLLTTSSTTNAPSTNELVTAYWVAHNAGGGSVANPTGTIASNSANNGSASTAMRSDGTPAISTTAVFQFSRLGLGAAADATIPEVIEIDSQATTPSPGLSLTNGTAAANNAQQVSPSMRWAGNGWGTTGGASQPVVFRAYTLPVQGATASGQWLLDASLNGGAFANAVTVTSGGAVTTAGGITVNNNGVVIAGGDSYSFSGNSAIKSAGTGLSGAGLILLQNTAGTAFVGLRLGPNVAAPSTVYIRPGDARGGTDTDSAGGILQLDGGISTGTGKGGAVEMRTSPSAASTANTANGQTIRYYLSAHAVSLTTNVATLVYNVSLASGKTLGVRCFATTRASDGTDFQSVSDEFMFSAVNKGGTVTVSTPTILTASAAGSSGVLSTAWTAVANGNGVDVKCNATSTVLVIPAGSTLTNWRIDIDSNDTTLAVTAQ